MSTRSSREVRSPQPHLVDESPDFVESPMFRVDASRAAGDPREARRLH